MKRAKHFINKIKIAFYRGIRLLNPMEWQMKLLGLKMAEVPGRRRGLILIQIDGLSHPDFQKSLKKGHLPFLKRLMCREDYRLHPMFSGIPSNTPAFQGEFFFGQKQCVPAFQFLDGSSGKVFTMFEKGSAEAVEKGMAEQSEGLLNHGSAYGNIFAGGAAESHVCASTADWKGVLKTWNPYSVLITALMSPYALIRGIVLCAAEIVLSVIDVFRGIFSGEGLVVELMFILSRIFSSIVIREVATFHVQMDIYRGLPVIQVNYFGYDEQAHRRGPSTRFAYWSLSGIDAAIKDIWYAATRSRARHYDVWIYSDHGQETVTSFSKEAGQSIQQAVQKVFEELQPYRPDAGAFTFHRNRAWGDMVVGGLNFLPPKKAAESRPTVTTLGPICQIYFSPRFTDAEKKSFAQKMIAYYPILPLIAIPLENGEVEYLNRNGIFHLPQDAAAILGQDHPYREAVAEDLKLLLQHEQRGDLMLFGWSAGMKAISFSNENGAHAGLGPLETQAFALLPQDAPLHFREKGLTRAYDLRQAALQVLGRKTEMARLRLRNLETREKKLRVISYNVHSCIGMDGILSPERIARVIAKLDPDIVALQELDAGRKTQQGNQAAAIAQELEMHFHFHAVCGAETQCFGNAILSRYPMRMIRAEHLPGLRKSYFLEPRGLLWVEADFFGKPVQIMNTHLSVWGPEQELQIRKLVGPEVLGRDGVPENLIVCGDFNMTPGSKFHQVITQHLKEPGSPNGKTVPNTWMSQWPLRRLDYIFMRGRFKGEFVELPRTSLESCASDHLPLIADFELLF